MRGVALLLLLAASAAAAAHVSDAFNFAVELPDGWETMAAGDLPPSALHQVGARGGRDKTLLLRVSRIDGDRGGNEEKFHAEFRRGLLSSMSGVRVVAERHTEVGGVPARTLQLAQDAPRPARFGVASFLADGRHFSVLVVAPGEGNEPDPEFSDVLASFRFLHPPALPEEQSTAFRIGYAIGYGLAGLTTAIGAPRGAHRSLLSRELHMSGAAPGAAVGANRIGRLPAALPGVRPLRTGRDRRPARASRFARRGGCPTRGRR